jgi:RHS repeat-associated protein
VDTSNAVLYADTTFASTNQPWASGNNTFTAIAKDVYGRLDTNSITVNIQLTNSYSYDLNGNLLSDGTRYFAYDDENQLMSVTVSNAWQSQFVYDGKLRKRIERDYSWNGSSWTQTSEVHYIYDGNVVIQERDSNNLPKLTYTRGNDLSGTLQGAGGIGGLLARSDNSQMILGSASGHAYYHADGNGNVTMLINNLQLMVAKYLYDPFGNTLSLSGPLANANTYRFSSKEWNDNAGLYYYLFRFYDPNLQRWLNRDPIEEDGGLNLYQFVGNGQLNDIDPLGLAGVIIMRFSNGTSLVQVVPTTTQQSSAQSRTERIEIVQAFLDNGGYNAAMMAVPGPEEIVIAKTLEKVAKPMVSACKANLARFKKKLPANATPTKIFDLPNNGKAFQADSPAKNIPGSCAQYEKQVDASGKTLQYTKTTFGPNGEIVNVKDKITGQTLTPEK